MVDAVQLNERNDRTPHILVVEDDWEIGQFVAAALHKNGFRASLVRDKTGAMRQFEREIPDLVILDVMLPGEDGFRILRRVRERFDTPVIMLTARTEPEDRVKGLIGGADDYVGKPFHTAELIARVGAVLRRHRQNDEPRKETAVYRFDGWSLDMRTRQVSDPEGITVLLTGGEFDVLSVLCRHAGRVLSRDRLVQISQNRMVEPYDRSVDTLVSRIRRKLQRHSGTDQIIKTVRNEGYLFTPKVQEITE